VQMDALPNEEARLSGRSVDYGTVSPRPSISASEGVAPSVTDAGSEWGAMSESADVSVSGRSSRIDSVRISVSQPTPFHNPAVDHASLPKPAEMIKAEMGVVLGKTLGRQVISVTLADDVPRRVAEWCAERNLSAGAQAKVTKELQSRLDSALAQAYQDAEQGGGATPALQGTDVC